MKIEARILAPARRRRAQVDRMKLREWITTNKIKRRSLQNNKQ